MAGGFSAPGPLVSALQGFDRYLQVLAPAAIGVPHAADAFQSIHNLPPFCRPVQRAAFYCLGISPLTNILYTIMNIFAIHIVHKGEHCFLLNMYILMNIVLCYNMCERRGVMAITYSKLFSLLKSRGYSSTYWLRQNGLHPATVNKLKRNERVNTDTINLLCRLLDCQPGDIMEYVEEKEEDT